MQKKFPLWILATLIVAIALVNGAADYWHLFFYIWWLDIPMHLVGGFWVGLSILTYYFSYQHQFPKNDSVRFAVLLAVVGAFGVSLGWEVFEFTVDRLNGIVRFDLIDTISDICNGVIGASVGTALFVWRGYNKTT